MATPYANLYYSTDDIKSLFKPSLSNYFDVHISKDFGNKVVNSDINFLAYEAVLPGSSFETTQVFGDRQGITQTYANKRTYPPVDVSFYVDGNYKVIEFFEQWMGDICPNLGGENTGETSSYTKFNYPETLKTNVTITKFEKDFRNPSDRLKSGGVINEPKSLVRYVLLNAFPVNIISLPVSYDQSGLLRTTITFNYDLYRYERILNNRKEGATKFDGTPSYGSQPGGDSGATLGELNRQVRLINENIPTTGLNPNPRDVG